jgi:Fur family transcriptional regulator, ferric uptake regulator
VRVVDSTALREALRRNGLRATPSRIAVLAVVRAGGEPMSHSEVARRLAREPWDRATIYRNLIDLADVGLVRRTDVGDHVWRFEAIDHRHAATAHPHFTCTACGAVECLPAGSVAVVPRRAPSAVRRRDVEVHLRGLCDDCS